MAEKEIGVGLLGLGVVGGGVARALRERGEYFARQVGASLTIRRAAVRNLSKPRTVDLPAELLTTAVTDILEDPTIAIVVEVMGGEEPAGTYVRRAIDAGKHVVTANKELIAKSGPELLAAAHERGLDIMFEASVGGGIPLIAPLRRDLLANRISSIRAIINGTTNFILTAMSRQGTSFAEALAEAQRLGYAEPDPTNDLEGIDAAYKLAIMAGLSFRARVAPDDIVVEGIANLHPRDFRYAEELGYAIKLLAVAERVDHGLVARVAPSLLSFDEPLSRVDGVHNAVQLVGDLTGTVMFQGQGAGADPTSSSVVADILDLAHSIVLGTRERKYWGPEGDLPVLGVDAIQAKYYVRVTVADRPGVLARISAILGDHQVSIAAVNQKEANEDDQTAELVIMTHRAQEREMRAALGEIQDLDVVTRLDAFLRVEG